jgi:WD40 repeat protein/DNA-binding SARP family transcriptional activator/energy-coupling factor transporter ATP-binding protein EcfA2
MDDVTDGGPRLRISVLGALRASWDRRELRLGGPKERAVLAVLAGRAGRSVPVAEIVAGVWGSQPPRTAEKTLQSYVMRLRRALRAAGAAAEGVLCTDAVGYRLAVPAEAVDALCFERLMERARRERASDPGLAAESYRAALALWRGPAYAGLVDAPWLQGEADRLDELRLVCVEERLGAELDAGGGDELVAEIEPLVGEHPLRERLWEALLLALYRAGRQAEALAAYRRARALLAEELAVEPGPGLRGLQAQILAHDPALAGEGPLLLGLPAGLAVAVPPLVGRQAELAWLASAWERAARGGGQVVVLDGGHGLGKTRLLAEFARDRWSAGSTVLYTAAPADGGAYLVVDQLAAALGESGDEARVVERGLSRLPAGPALVLVDDVHRAAVDGLRQLGELTRGATRPLLIVLAGDVERASPPVAAAIRRLEPDGSHTRRLPPLDEQAVEAVAAEYVDPAAADQVADLEKAVAGAGGVPLAVHQAAEAWAREQAIRRVAVAGDLVAMERAGLRAAHSRLVSGVLTLTRVHPGAQHGHTSAAEACPYPGLAAFDVGDAEIFVGRERAVAELAARLAGARVVVLVGPSGSGKSSLLRAGLMPALRAGALPGSQHWTITVSTPSQEQPVADEAAGGATRLTVVDQFEEIFAGGCSRLQRSGYVDRLLAGTDVLVLAVRAEYYGQLSQLPALAEYIADSTVLLGPMRDDEVRRAVVVPAQLTGVDPEPALVEQVVADVSGQPAALPLLSVALRQVWQRRWAGRLRLVDYQAVGGVRTAIATLADQALATLSEPEQRMARRILLRLADTDEQGLLVRRRATRAELPASADAVRALSVLVDTRLVTADQDTVEVTHEALLREWPRLRGWLDEDAHGRRLRRRLTPAALDWLAGGREPADLYRGARLAAAEEWAGQHPDDLNDAEREFLAASRQAADREAAELRARLAERSRTLRRTRLLLAAIAAVTAAAVAAGSAAVLQSRRAAHQALVADARRLGAQALVDPDLARALLLAREGVRLDDTVETRSNLLAALQRAPQAIGILSAGNRPQSVAVSPDGRLVASGDNAGTLRWWDTATLRPRGQLRTRPGSFFAVAFLPDGRLAAVENSPTRPPVDVLVVDPASGRTIHAPSAVLPAGNRAHVLCLAADRRGAVVVPVAGGLLIWRPGVQTTRLLRTPAPALCVAAAARTPTLAAKLNNGDVIAIDEATGAVRPITRTPGIPPLAISPDGRTIATLTGPDQFASPTGETGVALWTVGGRLLRTLARQSTTILRMVFSHDGTRLVTASDDYTATVWDVATGARSTILRGHSSRIIGAAFAPGDQSVWTAGFDNAVIHWDLTGAGTLAPLVRLPLKPPEVYWSTGSADRRYMAVTSYAGQVLVWDAVAHRIAGGPWLDHPARGDAAIVRGASVSVTGLVASTGEDHLLVIRRLSDGRRVSRSLLHRGELPDVTFSPDGSLLAVSAGDRRTELIDPVTGETRVPLSVGFVPSEVGFSPDGRRLAVASWDASAVAIYDTHSGQLVRRLDTGTPAVEVTYSPDGRLIATGSNDGHLRLWRADTGVPLGPPMSGHGADVLSLAFSSDGRTLASAGDGTVSLWDVASGRRIGTPLTDTSGTPPAFGFNFVTFDPTGRTVQVVDASATLRRWNVNPADWAARACQVANRQLTRDEWAAALPNRPYRAVCP